MSNRTRATERDELAAFLRSRRERLTPAQVGLPTTARRRTPGLRREEVAQIAGVGVTWYTWLEQGRKIQVSPHFLEQIARALRLDATERAHLFTLAHNRPPPLTSHHASSVTPTLRRMLEAIEAPAYLATASLDVVAWNTLLSAVFGDFEALAPEERNMLWLVFASPTHREAIPNWESEARGMLTRFRVEFGRHRDDPAFVALIERLQRASHEFHRWWPEHDLSWRGETTKSFDSPLGAMSMEQAAFAVEEAPDLRLVIYTPVDEATRNVVGRLKRAWLAKRRPRRSKRGRTKSRRR
jgi:transcriptional regulator with XRE-family HTH domain